MSRYLDFLAAKSTFLVHERLNEQAQLLKAIELTLIPPLPPNFDVINLQALSDILDTMLARNENSTFDAKQQLSLTALNTLVASLKSFILSPSTRDTKNVEKLSEDLNEYWKDYKKAYLYFDLECKIKIIDASCTTPLKALEALNKIHAQFELFINSPAYTKNLAEELKKLIIHFNTTYENDISCKEMTFFLSELKLSETEKNPSKIQDFFSKFTDLVARFKSQRQSLVLEQLNGAFYFALKDKLFLTKGETYSAQVYRAYSFLHPDKKSLQILPSGLREAIDRLQVRMSMESDFVFKALGDTKALLERQPAKSNDIPRAQTTKEMVRVLLFRLVELKCTTDLLDTPMIEATLRDLQNKNELEMAEFFFTGDDKDEKWTAPIYKQYAKELLRILYWYIELKKWQDNTLPGNPYTVLFLQATGATAATFSLLAALPIIGEWIFPMLAIAFANRLLNQLPSSPPEATASDTAFNRLRSFYQHLHTVLGIPVSPAALGLAALFLAPLGAVKIAAEVHASLLLKLGGQSADPVVCEDLLVREHGDDDEWTLLSVTAPVLNLRDAARRGLQDDVEPSVAGLIYDDLIVHGDVTDADATSRVVRVTAGK